MTNTSVANNQKNLNGLSLISKHKLNEIEKFKFRNISDVCFGSSMDPDKKTSEITFVFWMEQRDDSFVTSNYSTPSYTNYGKIQERFIINLSYDWRQDIWAVKSSFTKRRGSFSYDDTDKLPEKIVKQEEIFSYIRKSCIFFQIDPKMAEDFFAKALTFEIKVDFDEKSGLALIAQSDNCKDLEDKFKEFSKSQYSSTTSNYNNYNYGYGCYDEEDEYFRRDNSHKQLNGNNSYSSSSNIPSKPQENDANERFKMLERMFGECCYDD